MARFISSLRLTRIRGQLSLITATALVLSLMVPGIALAVHDLSMQLDGDMLASTTTNKGGSTQTVDWDSLFNSDGTKKTTLPANFTAAGFHRDFQTNEDGSFNTADSTTFATGSKDILNPTPGWQCNFDNNVNSKIDIMNAYATTYTDPATGDEILYFALERNANTGDGNVAFWFLQDEVGCVATTGTAAFVGDHVDGDLLVVSAFTKGGGVSVIDAYKWVGGADGYLDPVSVAQGHDCKTTATTGEADEICATTNSGTLPIKTAITSVPWLTSNKVDGAGHTLEVAEFFEGAVNLTALDLAEKCFNEFIADTRSSPSLTATLFDYDIGSLGSCTSNTTTSPSVSGSTTIPANAQLSVTDSVTMLDVNGAATWSGTYKFYLCFIGTDTSSTTLCASGGTLVDTKTISQATTVPFTSAAATVTSAGRYCWRGEFVSSTDGVPDAKDATSGECFNVSPRGPTLTTQASSGPVDFGSPISDTATLGNTAYEPATTVINGTPSTKAQGTITFFLYGPDQCTTLATDFPTTGVTKSVNGDGDYSSGNFTPKAPGKYTWVANYSGDSPNTSAKDGEACGDDTDEEVVVSTVPTQMSTTQKIYPNDSATITSSVTGNLLPADGSVTFSLYGSGPGEKTALQNCQAGGSDGRIYTRTLTGGGTHSFTVATDNTTIAITSNGSYYWLVTYDPGDDAYVGRQSSCTEYTVVTFTNDTGPGTTYTPPAQ